MEDPRTRERPEWAAGASQWGCKSRYFAFCWTQEDQAINREYLTTRNRQQLAKVQSAEMALEEHHGELISKEIVVHQAAFIFKLRCVKRFSTFRRDMPTGSSMSRIPGRRRKCSHKQRMNS